MEFFVVVLIFITCMIVLALLIYYCQERRNPDYDINEKQRDITSIALSIGAPELMHMQDAKSTMHSKNRIPIDFSAFYRQKGDKQNRVRSSHYNSSPDDLSDSDTSNSEKIYFSLKTTAYSVARRMSESNNSRMTSSPVLIRPSPVENKKLNGSSDCKIIITKGFADDDRSLDKTSLEAINKIVVRNHEVNEEEKEDKLSEIVIPCEDKQREVSLDEKLLKVPPYNLNYNQNYKIKRKNNSSSSLNVVEEEKE